MNCPKCNSVLEPVSGDFPTGVELDGYKETSFEEGFYCDSCDKVYDGDDLDEEILNDIDSVLIANGSV